MVQSDRHQTGRQTGRVFLPTINDQYTAEDQGINKVNPTVRAKAHVLEPFLNMSSQKYPRNQVVLLEQDGWQIIILVEAIVPFAYN